MLPGLLDSMCAVTPKKQGTLLVPMMSVYFGISLAGVSTCALSNECAAVTTATLPKGALCTGKSASVWPICKITDERNIYYCLLHHGAPQASLMHRLCASLQSRRRTVLLAGEPAECGPCCVEANGELHQYMPFSENTLLDARRVPSKSPVARKLFAPAEPSAQQQEPRTEHVRRWKPLFPFSR